MYFWLLILFSANAGAAQVIQRAQTASPLEYKSYLLASSQRQSPSQNYLSQHPSAANRNRFVQLIAEAQKKFLAGSTDEARDSFRLVLNLAAEEDWSIAEREALVYTTLRLAQISNSNEERDVYLKLSWTFGADVQPDSRLFPPPLLVRRTELYASFAKISVNTENLRKRFTYVIVNGFRIDLQKNEKFTLIDGDYRVTFISDSYAPQTHLGLASQLEGLAEDSTPLAQGSCERHSDQEFFGADCLTKHLEDLQLRPSVSLASAPVTSPMAVDFRIPTSSKPLYKKGWFWAGVGATAIAVVVLSQKKSEESSSPHTTYGF